MVAPSDAKCKWNKSTTHLNETQETEAEVVDCQIGMRTMSFQILWNIWTFKCAHYDWSSSILRNINKKKEVAFFFREYSLHIYVCIFLWLVSGSIFPSLSVCLSLGIHIHIRTFFLPRNCLISRFGWICSKLFVFFSSSLQPYQILLPLMRKWNKRTSFTSDTFII